MTPLETLTVDLPGRPYPVHVGPDATRLLAELAASARFVVIADQTVARLHLDRLRQSLACPDVIEVPSGESSKSLTQLARLYDRLAELHVGRGDVLAAFGGGMVGDLAGFAAATWMRGIRHVVLPTTLEAAIDAAVGGKTAINLPAGKNLVGAFHQPIAVAIDTRFLETLPERDFRAALSESVKHAVIADAEFFAWHEDHRIPLRERIPATITRLIQRNCAIKARIVAADERECGLRAILNYGHTIGHALEQSADYSLRHGECVALGMIAENRIALARGVFSPDDAARVESLLSALDLPVRAPCPIETDRVLAACRLDKKNQQSNVVCMLPVEIGRHPLAAAVSESELRLGLQAIGIRP